MFKPFRGFTLIEILISLLILCLILLGFDAMEMYALCENRDAYFLSVAENQINSMSNQLRMLSPSEDLTTLTQHWNQQNHRVLPQGRGSVAGQFPKYTVTIFWGDKMNLKSCDRRQRGKLKCLSIQVLM